MNPSSSAGYRFMRRFVQSGPVFLVCLVLLSAGCTTAHYRQSADKEAYGAVAQKTPLVKNMDEHFTIEQTNQLSLDGLPITTNVEEFLGPDRQAEAGGKIISLEKALEIGVQHSRSYQSSKEQLYLRALGLTLDRHQFAPIFSAGGTAQYDVTTSLTTNNTFAEARDVHVAPGATTSMLLRSGARISASLTADFFRYLAGDPSTVTSSHLLGQLAQPLWRGAGYKVTMENLTQSERNLLYALRDFVRFRKDFSVQIARAYYQVLGNRDAVRNGYLNLQSSRKNAERTRELSREGRVTQADLGRLEQQELTAESAWISAIRAYKQSLDDFKLQLGLPIEANLVLDDKELDQLKIIHPEISVDDSIRVALATRLDYQNLREQYDDADRKIGVAADALKAQVDLMASAGMDSKEVSAARLALPDPNHYNWNAGLKLDLPLERKAERNAYRTALITREQARRAMDQREDEIRQQVRDSWRVLDQAKRSFEISEIGVKLAERRVEEQNLLAELGRAKAQDQVDAQNDLINSKNQRTQALVGHTIARLQFWVNMGILYIKDNGQWEEVTHVKPE